MDFDPNAQQSEVLNGLEQLIAAIPTDPPAEGALFARSPDLEAALADAGYLDIVEAGLELIDGALVVDRLARLPVCVEAAASVLVRPAAGVALPRPIAIASSAPAPTRYLPMARILLVDGGQTFLAIHLDGAEIEPVTSLLAYPYGRLRSLDGLTTTRIADAATLRRRWRIAIAVEAAGMMRPALDLVLDHVKTRRMFGHALGAFQAVQHRLVLASEVAEAARWLALKAADSDDDGDAAIAAAYAQDAIPRFTTDLHQFCGAMGLTLEYPLHYWTYRLRALLGELGGSSGQARAAAQYAWGQA
ncbi:acyl-CoA dehydrogenase [Nostoc sp. 3335mG]|nr:acyl-CoA dehydrogenase [Nostoc sp. 3335mG]